MSEADRPSAPPADRMDALAALDRAGRLRDVVAEGAALAQAWPLHAPLLQMLGIAHARLGEAARAGDYFERVVARTPRNPGAHINLGNSLRDRKRPEDALRCYDQAVALGPDMPEAHYNRGNALSDLGRLDQALTAFDRAIALREAYPQAHQNRGDTLFAMKRDEAAVAAYRRAAALRPGALSAFNNMSVALRRLGRLEEAVEALDRLLALDPANDVARARRLYLLAQLCDWDAMATDRARIPDLGTTGAVIPPFTMLALDDDPLRHRIRSERCAARDWPAAAPAAVPAAPADAQGRLRIGYFSADFHDHATMHLMAGLFERHDREGFAVHAFSYGPDADDPMRRRLLGAVERFHDVRPLDDVGIAALARAEGIDIAIDLKGHTADSRTGLFAHRPAPVQIAYLGYPGTTGAPFIDYIVADKTVLPADHRGFYSEAPIWLPGSYQVNDDRRIIADTPLDRAQFGLPDTGFVFASFNNSYKITPDLFAVWMRLLARVDDAVLWLLAGNPAVATNLRKEAGRHGIDPARLVFTGRIAPAEHLARHAHADLFLDSFLCNAHTTASDALWAGLPVLTKTGAGFATRVAASLLGAVGLPELITESVEAYERLALALATDRGRLAAIRARLAAGRDAAPLFDSAAFAHHLESAYRAAWAHHLAGDPPAPIEIAA